MYLSEFHEEVKIWLWGKVLQPYRKGLTVPEIYYVLVRTLKVSVPFYSMHFEDMTAISSAELMELHQNTTGVKIGSDPKNELSLELCYKEPSGQF